ncbi:MAG: hypothetical protein HY748_18725 [Elusimicrobia bacterium]|nr:hypothetical protein [Elusimicrobiota bacterium]
MKPLSRVLAVALVYCIGVQPTLAQAQNIRVQTGQVNSGAVNAGVAVPKLQLGPGSVSGQNITLSINGVLPSVGGVQLAPSVIESAAPGVPGADVPLPLDMGSGLPVQAPEAVVPVLTPTLAPGLAAVPADGKASVETKLADTSESVSIAGKELKEARTDETGRDAVAAQFNALTGELFYKAAPAEEPVAASLGPGAQAAVPSGSGLAKPVLTGTPQAEGEAKASAEVPAAAAEKPAQGSWKQVFKDPERNKSFWRYLKGYAVFLVGFQAYMVGLPYLISAFTKNTLKESNDARLENAEALKALIRRNRSLARVAHWVSQAFAYITVPLFTAKNADNPKKWLVRSMLIRSVLLTTAVGVFFFSGIFSMPVALAILFGLIGIHSFFQGLTVTMESASKTRVFGDKSVTPEERRKANSIITFVAAVISIIGPALAGQLAQVKDFFGKTGVGGAMVYGIYGIAVGVAGLIYATVKMFGNKAEAAAKAQAAGEAAPAKGKGVIGVVKDLGRSLKDGLALILKNRFLRTMLGLTLVSYLFSDPLVFNVLPEFAAGIIKGSSSLQAILNLPVIGWFFKGLTSTPMGYFALMNVMASVGSILATSLVKPLTKLFNKLGFKTEESLMVPFYVIAAIEVPLFWLMIFSPSMWMVVLLYGLQSFVLGFGGIAVAGVDQKVSGGFSKEDLPKVLAAQSFVGIVSAIISTLVYGFLLGNIAISTSLYIAAIATTVLGALRLAAPFMAFSKEARRGKEALGAASGEAKK